MVRHSIILIICFIGLFSLSNANWAIELKLLEVQSYEPNYPPHEAVLYQDIQWGGDKKDQIIKTSFDSTSFSNWIISKYCQDCVQKHEGIFECISDDQCKIGEEQKLSVYALGGKYKFSKAQGIDLSTNEMKPADETVSLGNVDINLNGQQFNLMSSLFPKRFEGKPMDKWISDMYTANSGLTAGLGLGSLYQNYENFVINKQFKKQIESKQFSLYVSNSFSKAIFGKEEGYFAKSNFEKFRNMKEPSLIQLKGTFTILLDSIQFQGNSQSLLKNEYYVNFDTTTQFIWVPVDVFDALFSKFQVSDASCSEEIENKLICKAENMKKFPNLQFTFKNGKTVSTYSIEPQNYLYPFREQNQQKYQVMIKKLRWVEGQETKQIPSLPILNSIWLGYPFFKQYYTVFNYEQDTISIAQKANIGVKGSGPEAKKLNDFWHLLFIILAILFLLGTLIALFALLTKVPFKQQGNLSCLKKQELNQIEPQSPTQVVFQTVPIQQQQQQIQQQQPVQIIQIQQPVIQRTPQYQVKAVQYIQQSPSTSKIVYQSNQQQQILQTPPRQSNTNGNIFVPSGQN